MTPSVFARIAYGTVLFAAPDVLLGRGASDGGDRRFRTVVCILGARHVVHAFVVTRWPTRTVRRAGALADALHAATDIGCALFDRRRRRPAAADAAVAFAFAFAGAER